MDARRPRRGEAHQHRTGGQTMDLVGTASPKLSARQARETGVFQGSCTRGSQWEPGREAAGLPSPRSLSKNSSTMVSLKFTAGRHAARLQTSLAGADSTMFPLPYQLCGLRTPIISSMSSYRRFPLQPTLPCLSPLSTRPALDLCRPKRNITPLPPVALVVVRSRILCNPPLTRSPTFSPCPPPTPSDPSLSRNCCKPPVLPSYIHSPLYQCTKARQSCTTPRMKNLRMAVLSTTM
jgi:hypothetical protein